LILVDAGPLVAFVDADDQHHAKCAAALKGVREPLATVWPPLAEALYLLADLPKAQDALWEMLQRGALQLLPLDSSDVPRIRELMRKYANRPMDLADAALIRVAEREGLRRIFTVDRRDFAVYRLHNRVRPVLLP
jgi:predicted nucleic acid-binding protein